MTQSVPLPYDAAAESAVLGSCLIDPDAISKVDWLRPTDFHVVSNQIVFRAMMELAQAGTPLDMVTVCNRIGGDELREIGGAAYLSRLITDTPTSFRIVHYARIVRRCADRRRLRMELQKGLADLVNGQWDDLEGGQIRDGLIASLQEAIETSSTDWTIHTLADAYKEQDPVQYAIAPLFELPSLSILYGSPGTLKTMLLSEAGLCVAAGLSWLDPLPGQSGATAFQTRQCPVLWIDLDNGARRMHERIAAMGRARGLGADVPFHYTSMPDPWLDLSDPRSVGAMVERIGQLGAQLVAIDNLRVVSGDADENAADMSHVMSNARRIAEETGAAIVLIHHQRKATGFKGRDGETLRGHSSIEAAIDLALLVERDDRADIVTVRSTKTRGVDVPPFGAMWTYTHKNGTEELQTGQFFGVPVEDKKSTRAIDRAIVEALEVEGTLNKSSLTAAAKEALDVGTNAIRARIDYLVSQDRLTEKTGKRTEKLYTLSGGDF